MLKVVHVLVLKLSDLTTCTVQIQSCVYVVFPSHILIPYLISDCRSCSSERKDFPMRFLVLPRPQIGIRRSS